MIFFLTLDLEEWYHLDYFKDYDLPKHNLMLNELDSFFKMLNKYNIKITVFVLAELIDEHSNLIKSISDMGHEIAIHGWNHEVLNNKDNKVFKREIIKAKTELERLINKEVIGYRAPCFSMNDEKLSVIKEIGLKYDSSYIQFKEHPLYGSLNLNDFVKIDDLIYLNENFYEFELVTLNIFGKSIPISGGGYFRLFPPMVFSYLWKKFKKKHHNYIMYIHPFELTDKKVALNGIDLIKKVRFSIGRKNNLKKLENHIIKSKKEGFRFLTIKNYIKKYESKKIFNN